MVEGSPSHTQGATQRCWTQSPGWGPGQQLAPPAGQESGTSPQMTPESGQQVSSSLPVFPAEAIGLTEQRPVTLHHAPPEGLTRSTCEHNKRNPPLSQGILNSHRPTHPPPQLLMWPTPPWASVLW